MENTYHQLSTERIVCTSDGDSRVGLPLEFEEIDEVLWGHGREAAVRVSCRAGVTRVLQGGELG